MHLDEIRALPKVVLHDHLDGGLRPQTVIDLADDCGYAGLPTRDGGELAQWFYESAESGSLPKYLETFEHTVSVMQTEEAITRVAEECVQDLADDGVVYAEVRFAPELLTIAGLSMAEAVEAALDGLETDLDIEVNLLLCAMRQSDRADEVADLVVAYAGDGVVGMDLAGPERGYPASAFRAAFTTLRENMCQYTVHAGEAVGVESIADALIHCAPQRLGHGVRIVDDIRVLGDEAELGRVAQYVLDRQIPLELCPTSNVQTGAARSVAEHPITLLRDLGFAVTVNPDNRLHSGAGLSEEMFRLVRHAGWELDDLSEVTLTAARSAFMPYDDRVDLIDGEIKPAWQA